ncbi:MAG: TerB family tellurite resistance protein [Pseudomonadota bacterium]
MEAAETAAQTATVAMVRAMVAMGLADGEIGTAERATIKQVYRMASGAELEDEIIDLIARNISTNDYTPRDVMAMTADDLDDSKKRRVIQSAYFVMTADEEVTEKEAACLLALAEGLGMGQAGFDAAIAELEEMVGAREEDSEGETAKETRTVPSGGGESSDDAGQDYNGAAGPRVDPAEIFLNAMFRAMVGIAVCDGPMTPEERQTIKKLFDQVGHAIDDPTIDGFIMALEGANATVGEILARDADAIEPSMKPRIIQSAYFVVLASDDITDEENACLIDISNGLGMARAELDEALASVGELLSDG